MRFRKLYRDERGMSLVFVALGFMGFFAATMLAIDVGMLMTARSQAQNSADAGALAGAVAMAFVDFDDHSPTGPAVTGAIRQSTANQVMYSDVSVKPEDVEFLQDSRGIYSQVRVTVHRNAERGNPVNTVIASLFGINTANINAIATAQVSPADRPARCFPFMIPDKWRELTEPPFNSVTSTYDLFDKKVPLTKPDQYKDAMQADYTGYDQNIDTGTVIVLKRGSGTNVSPSEYNPFRIPGNGEGADRYREAILNGPCGNMKFGDRIEPETGDMVGPTKQGVDELITLYPDARWDTSCQCARGNPDHIAMREGVIPLYDPDFYERGKQTGNTADFKAAGFLGVFLEGMVGNDVRARVVPVAGTRSEDGPWPEHSFLKAIQLIK